MQFHGGVYRSDDDGETWMSIADGLPSDFGFPIAGDPADPDSAFVIPMHADVDRTTVGGAVAVYETRDAGATWTARDRGLPTQDAFLTVLRQAFDADGEGEGLGLWFGATSGEVFGSVDAGRSWFTVAPRLAPVTSVRVCLAVGAVVRFVELLERVRDPGSGRCRGAGPPRWSTSPP